MNTDVLFYLGFCATLPFFYCQFANIIGILQFYLKKKVKQNGAHLHITMLLGELVCTIIWFSGIGASNRLFSEKPFWYQVPWKIIVCCIVCMILSRCLGYFIVWTVKKIKGEPPFEWKSVLADMKKTYGKFKDLFLAERVSNEQPECSATVVRETNGKKIEGRMPIWTWPFIAIGCLAFLCGIFKEVIHPMIKSIFNCF